MTNFKEALLQEKSDLQTRINTINDLLKVYSSEIPEVREEPKKLDVEENKQIAYSDLEVKDVIQKIKDFFIFNPEIEYSVKEITSKINELTGVNVREHVIQSSLQRLFYGSVLRKNKYGPQDCTYFLPKDKRKKGERTLGFTRPNQGIGEAVKELILSLSEDKAITEQELFDLLQSTDFPKLLHRTLRNCILSLMSTKQIREKNNKYYGR